MTGESKAEATPIVKKTTEMIIICFLPSQAVLSNSIISISSELLSIYNDLSKAIIETRLVVYPTISATLVFPTESGFLGTKTLLPGNNLG